MSQGWARKIVGGLVLALAIVFASSSVAPSAHAGTKNQGTKNQGTKNQGTKNQGTKNQGTKNQGTKNQGTKNQGTKNQGTKNQGTKNQGTKNQGTKNQGTKNQGTKNQGTKNQGTKNQGTKNQGTENQGTKGKIERLDGTLIGAMQMHGSRFVGVLADPARGDITLIHVLRFRGADVDAMVWTRDAGWSSRALHARDLVSVEWTETVCDDAGACADVPSAR